MPAPPPTIAAKAGIALPPDKTFFLVEETNIGKQHPYSTEKLGVVLAVFKAHGFDDALDKVRQIFETGGRGHSCGIYSFNDDHINRLALMAPVSRIMVRQVQSSSNAGTFTNGMPMTSSMGCGIWGGNITNENVVAQALHERDLGAAGRFPKTSRRKPNSSASSTTRRSPSERTERHGHRHANRRQASRAASRRRASRRTC